MFNNTSNQAKQYSLIAQQKTNESMTKHELYQLMLKNILLDRCIIKSLFF